MSESGKKILIATVFWKRHDILKMFCKNNGKFADILAVGSEKNKSRSLAKSLGCHYYEAKNRPLAAKFDARIKWFMARPEYSHILLLGSDDLICKRTFDRIDKERLNYDLISWKDIYFYHLKSESGIYSCGYRSKRSGEPFAPGRCISRRYLESIGGTLWPHHRAGGPDKSAWNTKLKFCKNQTILSLKENDSIIVDIKTEENITSIEAIGGVTNSNPISDDEKRRIRRMINDAR